MAEREKTDLGILPVGLLQLAERNQCLIQLRNELKSIPKRK